MEINISTDSELHNVHSVISAIEITKKLRCIDISQCKCEKIIHHLIFDLLFHPANGFKHLKELRICISSASINDIFFLLKHCIVERLIMFSHYFVKK